MTTYTTLQELQQVFSTHGWLVDYSAVEDKFIAHGFNDPDSTVDIRMEDVIRARSYIGGVRALARRVVDAAHSERQQAVYSDYTVRVDPAVGRDNTAIVANEGVSLINYVDLDADNSGPTLGFGAGFMSTAREAAQAFSRMVDASIISNLSVAAPSSEALTYFNGGEFVVPTFSAGGMVQPHKENSFSYENLVKLIQPYSGRSGFVFLDAVKYNLAFPTTNKIGPQECLGFQVCLVADVKDMAMVVPTDENEPVERRRRMVIRR